MYLIINYYREKYYSVQPNMFFASHLFQVCWNQSLTMHSNLKRALCKWVGVNLNNIANVQYNYLLIIHKEKLPKVNREHCFYNNSLPSHLCRFLPHSLCLELSRFSSKKIYNNLHINGLYINICINLDIKGTTMQI